MLWLEHGISLQKEPMPLSSYVLTCVGHLEPPSRGGSPPSAAGLRWIVTKNVGDLEATRRLLRRAAAGPDEGEVLLCVEVLQPGPRRLRMIITSCFLLLLLLIIIIIIIIMMIMMIITTN